MFALGVASGGGEGGWCSISLLFENSILLIRVQGYRGLTEKWQTVETVHTLRYSVLKSIEYFPGVVFSYSFSIYCAANHGILCSVYGMFLKITPYFIKYIPWVIST